MLEVAIKSNIDAVLKQKGVSAYKLAQMMGKHSNHIYRLAKRDHIDDVSLKTMAGIANALGVTVDSLFTVEPD